MVSILWSVRWVCGQNLITGILSPRGYHPTSLEWGRSVVHRPVMDTRCVGSVSGGECGHGEASSRKRTTRNRWAMRREGGEQNYRARASHRPLVHAVTCPCTLSTPIPRIRQSAPRSLGSRSQDVRETHHCGSSIARGLRLLWRARHRVWCASPQRRGRPALWTSHQRAPGEWSSAVRH